MSLKEIIVDGRHLKDMKVAELKVACKARNLPIGGNKATIAKRLQAAIELENLKKSALNSDGAVQPNCNIDDKSAENDFVKQYLENQRKMLQKQHHRFSSASEAESEDDAPKKQVPEGKNSPLAEAMSPPQPVAMLSPKQVSKTVSNEDESDQEKSVTIQKSEDTPKGVQDSKSSIDQTDASITEEQSDEEAEIVKPVEKDLSASEVSENSKVATDEQEASASPPQLSPKQNVEQSSPSKEQEDVPEPPNTESAQIEPQEKVSKDSPAVNDDLKTESCKEITNEIPPLQQDKNEAEQSPKQQDGDKKLVSDDTAADDEEVAPSNDNIDMQSTEAVDEDESSSEKSAETTERDENIKASKDCDDNEFQMQEQNNDEVMEAEEKPTEEKMYVDEAKDVEGVPVITMDTDVLMEEVEELDYDEVDMDKSESQETQPDEEEEHSTKKKINHKEERGKTSPEHSREPKKLRKLKRLSRDEVKAPQEKETNGTTKSKEATSSDINQLEKPDAEPEERSSYKPSRRRISIKKSLNRSVQSDQPREKKRKWGKATAADSSQINISTDSLKDIIEVKKDAIRDAVVDLETSPIKPIDQNDDKQEESEEEEGEIVEEVVVEEEVREEQEDVMEETVHQDKRKVIASNSAKEKSMTEKRSIKVHERRSSSKKDHHALEKEPSSKNTMSSSNHDVAPARMPVSCVVHVSNLVRPFALSQLKQLLSDHGDFIPESFWINTIKSHCFVTYKSEEVAVESRNFLHNLKWPVSSPKRLVVEYSTQEEVDWNKQEQPLRSLKPAKKRKTDLDSSREIAPKKSAKDIERKSVEREDRHEHREHKRPQSQQEKDEPKRGRERERTPPDHDRHHSNSRRDRSGVRRREEEHGSRSRRNLREWDMHKLDQDDEVRRNRKPDPSSPESRPRRREEPTPKPPPEPPKLLDDLFRKTEATPCVYWLPLTEQQITERENEREKRRSDRAKVRREVDDEQDGRKQEINKDDRGVKREALRDVDRPKEEKRREERVRESGSGRTVRREEDAFRGSRKEPVDQRSRGDQRKREERVGGQHVADNKSKLTKPTSQEKTAKESRRRKQSSSSSSSDSSDSDSSSGTSDSGSSSSSDSESEEESPKKAR